MNSQLLEAIEYLVATDDSDLAPYREALARRFGATLEEVDQAIRRVGGFEDLTPEAWDRVERAEAATRNPGALAEYNNEEY